MVLKLFSRSELVSVPLLVRSFDIRHSRKYLPSGYLPCVLAAKTRKITFILFTLKAVDTIGNYS